MKYYIGLREIIKYYEIFKINAKLTKLKKEYQEIILLRFIEDLDYAEIAKVLGKKESGVRVLLYRAIQALKEIL